MYDEVRDVYNVHDEKIETLIEMVEAVNGAPVLVAYAFKHEEARIMEALKPFGARRLNTVDDVREWNEGKYPY